MSVAGCPRAQLTPGPVGTVPTNAGAASSGVFHSHSQAWAYSAAYRTAGESDCAGALIASCNLARSRDRCAIYRTRAVLGMQLAGFPPATYLAGLSSRGKDATDERVD
jgi:hypothetical protein